MAQVGRGSSPNNGRRLPETAVRPDDTGTILDQGSFVHTDPIKIIVRNGEISGGKSTGEGTLPSIMTSTEENITHVLPFTGKGQMTVMKALSRTEMSSG